MKSTEPTNLTLFKTTLTILNERDLNILKGVVNEQVANIQMGLLNKTKLITAAVELVRNMLKYAGGGQAVIETIRRDDEVGISITCADQGPGIADVTLVMRDGYSTGNTLGLGLPGAQRLTDEFSIVSKLYEGTTITIIKWVNG